MAVSISALLMAMEGRAVLEWASFALTWPWLKQAPRGDGHPVLVLPGLAAGDSSTKPLRHFLEHLGYAVSPWEQGPNFGPRDHVIKGLVDRVRGLETGVPAQPDFREALRTQRVCDAVLRSAVAGTWENTGVS